MGYETALYLVNVKIKAQSLPTVDRVMATRKGRGLQSIRDYFEFIVIDDSGCLAFKPDKDFNGGVIHMPNDDDGTVPAVIGKWYTSEKLAKWIKAHSEKGGRLIQHSVEGDGHAWGWEFDGRGRMRCVELKPAGRWE